MKKEFIYAIQTNIVAGVLDGLRSGCTFCPTDEFSGMEHGLIAAQRERLESDESYRQIIPYVAVRRPDGAILVYRRTSKSGESRLIDKVSIGFGGHVDLIDGVMADSFATLSLAIESGAERELAEELNVDSDRLEKESGKMAFKGFIVDQSSPVGRVHLGFAFIQDVSTERSLAIASNEAHVDIVEWFTPEQILAKHEAGEFDVELWSLAFIGDMLAV